MFTRTSAVAAGVLAFAILLGGPGEIAAQDGMRGVPVTERPRPELDPLGIRMGAFVLRPRLRLGLLYDDNVYATRNNREQDFAATARPSLTLESDWTRHALRLDVDSEVGRYFSETNRDYLDAGAAISGRLDVLRETFLTGRLSHARRHEQPGDPDVETETKKPSIFYLTRAEATGFRGVGRVSFRLGTSFERRSFRSVELIDGTRDSQSDRDRNRYDVTGRVSYELLPSVIPFVQAGYQWRRFDSSHPVNRDSDGYRLAMGTGFDLGGIVTGEVHAGYLRQMYKSSDRSNLGAFWFGGSVLWNVTRLTSIQTAVERRVADTEAGGAGSAVRTSVNTRIDHELLRNLLIGARVNYTHDRFEDRNLTDHYIQAGPRITYLWNRYLTAELSYTHNTRRSSNSDRKFRSNQIFFAITGHF